MTNRERLAEIVRAVSELDSGTDTTWAAVGDLAASGDQDLMPFLHDALDTFLAQGNVDGRDLVAEILAGIGGTAAFPALLRASACDLGDEQDRLGAIVMGLIDADRAGCRPTILAYVRSPDPALRLTGLWALDLAVEPSDREILDEAAHDIDPHVREAAMRVIYDQQNG